VDVRGLSRAAHRRGRAGHYGVDRPTEAVIRRLIEDIGDIGQVLADADPKDMAEIYAALGRARRNTLTGDLSSKAQPIASTTDGVGGGTGANPDWKLTPWSGA
jgi:hypothetical protein